MRDSTRAWLSPIVSGGINEGVDFIGAIEKALYPISESYLPGVGPRDVKSDPEDGKVFDWIIFGNSIQEQLGDERTHPDS